MLLKGKPVADKIKNEIISAVNECRDSGRDLPKLAILRVGKRADDVAYESRVLKNCAELGIAAEVKEADNNIGMADFLKVLETLNQDPKIHGILIFRPLPAQLDMDIVSRTIKPEKDIDCMSPANAEKIFTGDKSGIPPCTPEAVIEILKYYQYDLIGKNVAVVNRSMVLGKPLSMLFLNENSTVTICHSKTKNLSELTSKADIVVTGAGKAKYFGKEFFSQDSVVVDVGINLDKDDKLCGDVDFKDTAESVAAISPVPGGVGTVTSMILLKHVIRSMELQREIE
jgi:methylenetetrahydrofolate dehydrogenase (NADP+)/methenyltetrahydrofolate cyclohydrolase